MPRRPTALLTLAGSALLLAADSRAQSAPYRWTISASDTDPFVNSTSPPGTNATFYLWLECSNPPGAVLDGMASAEFDIVATGSLLLLGTEPVNGFFNAGTTSSLLLAVGNCEGGPIVAANLLVLDQGGGGTIGLEASAGGNKGVVDCSPTPDLWPMNWIGLGVGEPTPSKGEGCPPVLPGACCLPDGSCVETKPGECIALGGVYQGDGVNCSGQCPVTTGACCFEDGGCADVETDAECEALGGVFLGSGTRCADGCPSFAGACCMTGGSCVVADGPQDCAAQGGVFQGAGTDCVGGCPALMGACCLEDGSCVFVHLDECAAQFGAFQGVGTECSDACPSLVGACCFADGSCTILGPQACAAQGGFFRGPGTVCMDCAGYFGACCFEDNSCEVMFPAECAAQGGVFRGLGSVCTGDCPVLTGACCFPDGSCAIADGPLDCADRGGLFQGTGTDCSECTVESPCCLSDGSCQMTDAATCATLGGEFRGAGRWDCRICNPREPAAVTWTISASPFDPFVNSRSGSGFGMRYLWLVCSHFPASLPEGLTAAAFDIEATGTVHVMTYLHNGFLNAGTKSSLLLTVGNCPVGPVLAASFLVMDEAGAPGSLCFAPSSFAGVMTVVDCRPQADPWSIRWLGFLNNGVGDPCSDFTSCQTTALQRKSWGQIKALYR
jgi:hypothetical protein